MQWEKRKKSIFEKNIDNKASAFYSFLLPAGEIVSKNGFDELMKIDGVVYSTFRDMNIGDVVEKYKDKTSRYGLIVIKGETRNDLDKIWYTLKKKLRVDVKTDNGIKGIIWE